MSNIIDIAKKIKEYGGNLYLVGGAVRDSIIGIDVYDEDYCVTGLSEDEFKNLFPEAIVRGKFFEVFEIDGKEFALARTESKSGIGHKEFDIVVSKDITIEEDLKRRDLTINSIAKDVLTGEIIDPFGGIEDPLRAYRAARFACKLGFRIEEGTISLMSQLKGELSTLSVERVFDELKKALSYDEPSIFFNELRNADILDIHFEEIKKLIGALQPIEHHPEGDAYNHTMLALDRCASLTKDVKIRFAVLVHDLGKGLTPKEEYPHHVGHDIKGVPEVEKMAVRLKLPGDYLEYGTVAAREHMRAGIFDRMNPNKQVDFIERIYKTKIGLRGMEIVVDSDRNCRGNRQDKVTFAELGERLINEVTGKKVMEQFGMKEGTKLKEKIHEQRVCKLKEWKTMNSLQN